jgi:hypothetical protein
MRLVVAEVLVVISKEPYPVAQQRPGVYLLTALTNGADHETFRCTVRGSPSVGSAV